MRKFKLGQLIGNRVILGVDKRPTKYPYLVSGSSAGYCLEKWKEVYSSKKGMEFETKAYDNFHCSWCEEEEVEELIANSFKLGQEVIYKGNAHRIIGVDINDDNVSYFIETKKDGASSLRAWMYRTGYDWNMLRYIKEEEETKGVWVCPEKLSLPSLSEEVNVKQPSDNKKGGAVVNKIEVLKYKIFIELINGELGSYIVEKEQLEEDIEELMDAINNKKTIKYYNNIIPVHNILRVYWEKIEEEELGENI